MKTVLRTLIFNLFLCSSSNAQQPIDTLNALLVLDSNDTITGKVICLMNYYSPDIIYESSFNSEVSFINSEGFWRYYKYTRIKLLTINDLNNVERSFVPKEGYPRLLELIYRNKVEFYKNHINLFDGTQSVSFEIFDENGKLLRIGEFDSMKRKLKKLAKGKAKTLEFIANNDMTEDNIIKALKLYESELLIN